MSIPESRRVSGESFSTVMPARVIPVRRTPFFMKALWLLAAFVLVGIAYSFWRISTVATPKLELPSGAQPASSQPT
jgi:hypothetical protein